MMSDRVCNSNVTPGTLATASGTRIQDRNLRDFFSSLDCRTLA